MTLVSELLVGMGSGVELISEQIITTSSTWTKPAAADPNDLVEGYVWGPGGNGRADANGPAAGGGACHPFKCRVRDLDATISVTIGAPGGQFSAFGKFRAFAGASVTTSSVSATSGGGIHAPGEAVSSTFGRARGGGPAGGGGGDGEEQNYGPGDYGGGGSSVESRDTIYGGAGPGGNSVYGGAGGNGKSIFGGDGATDTTDAQAPGGGGISSAATPSRRFGARGQVTLRIWRGI